ncbi:MAG: isopenicillin N synthase family oxygenase, partial [Myxococcales bacterium]|nr:isopenicillin N synthase family oxygenase [Myxococcales bacterium]
MERGIPVIDLDALAGPAGSARDAQDAALLHGLSAYGLVHVKAATEAGLLDRFYQSFRAFTRLPDAAKRALGGPGIWHQRGYTPPDTEQAVVAGGQPDFKECYFAAPLDVDPACEAEYPEIFARNVWPPAGEGFDPAAFEADYLHLGRRLHGVGEALLRGAARALGLDEDTFQARLNGGAHVTRALQYLPLTAGQVEDGVLWGEEHTDFNLLTLLPGGRFFDPTGTPCASPDPSAGLYLRSRPTADNPAGLRVQGVAPAGCMLAQVGQQLEILTGGRLVATPHVITAPRQPGYTRCSMAHFIHVHPHQVLRPLPAFNDDAARAAYRPTVLAGTYALKTLVDIGLA